jgi:succinyl-CoA synthetase (ADP-forming) beta subunit (EC 6.2.1.5)
MKLYEYEARQIFEEFKIPVPKWGLASNVNEALKIAEEISFPVVVKAQVLVGGRGKAGGIKFANNREELIKVTNNILNLTIKGEKVSKVIISKYIEIKQELYLSVIMDRSARKPLILASKEGGMDIEQIAKEDPRKVLRIYVNPLIGLQDFIIRKIEKFLEIKNLKDIVNSLYEIFVKYDCELAEINPLGITYNGELYAVDAKIIIDDSALYRQKRFGERIERELNEYEMIARESGFSYVEHDGDIGIISNGAGLTMSTMDLVQYYGGRPANFLDIGGGASSEVVYKALRIQLKHPRTKSIFINILGGITRCDEVAQGIIKALNEVKTSKKIVVRMKGTNEEEGKKMLNEIGIYTYDEMDEAAQEAVKI